MSLRITGGEARGRSIASPRGLDVRPTSSKIRQALFNILGGRIKGANFLDLFGGTGLMGIEALSRGAAELTTVEQCRKLASNISDSLDKLSFEAETEVIVGDVREVLKHLPPKHFDIIFADPPYKSPLAKTVLRLVHRHSLLSDGGLLIIEHAKDTELPLAELNETAANGSDKATLQLFDRRDYGQTCISFFTSDNKL